VSPAPQTLSSRYSEADLELLEDGARARFLAPFLEGRPWSEIAPSVAWELLYRKEPALYERLIRGEHLHPDALAALPRARRCVEVAAGTGRLTAHLLDICEHVTAIEPAEPLRAILTERFAGLEVRGGYFDDTGLPDATADLVASCSAFRADPAHGGEAGLDELDRITAVGGTIAVVWPADVDWLRERGFSYASFPGDLAVEFESLDEALELAAIFYPQAVGTIARRGAATVPFEVLGMNAPRDVAWRVKA
jgi:SAM-dependent methyltransferase